MSIKNNIALYRKLYDEIIRAKDFVITTLYAFKNKSGVEK